MKNRFLLSKKLHIREDKTLNSRSTIAFLKKIEDAYPTKEKVYLFCDNAKYYQNHTAEAYLEKSKVELHFLPPYSLNPNPIERLWKWVKERVTYNTYYEYFEDFKAALLGVLDSVSALDPEFLQVD